MAQGHAHGRARWRVLITTGLSTFGEPETGLSLGAGEGIRTLDPNLGKVVLYP
jgi:hypothetical protein